MTILEERASVAGTSGVAGHSGSSQRDARRAMIDSQLRVSGVNNPAVLAAFDAVPREDFVPAAMKDSAYIDRAVPLGDGAMLAAPLVHGLILNEAAPAPGQQVLVVSSNGYLAALAQAMSASVTVQSPSEAATAKKGAEASLILIDGAIEHLPAALAARLAEGGRIVTGLAERGVTRLASGTKIAGEVSLLPLLDVGMPILAEFAAPKRWSF